MLLSDAKKIANEPRKEMSIVAMRHAIVAINKAHDDIAAELIRARGLLDLVVAQGDKPCRSAYDLHEIRAMAKSYLAETEG